MSRWVLVYVYVWVFLNTEMVIFVGRRVFTESFSFITISVLGFQKRLPSHLQVGGPSNSVLCLGIESL